MHVCTSTRTHDFSSPSGSSSYITPSLRTPRSRYPNPSSSHLRKSWTFEPISEEPAPEIPVDHIQRHHRPRAKVARTVSAPHLQLISTNTTKPIHIHHLRSVFISLLFVILLFHLPLPSQRPIYNGLQPSSSRRVLQRPRARLFPHRLQNRNHRGSSQIHAQ